MEIDLFYQNCRGLRGEIAHGLRDRITLRNYKIIGLTETWLCDSFASESIFNDTYIVHRADRTHRTYVRNQHMNTNNSNFIGGGSLIAIKKNISACRMSIYNNW